MRSDQFWHKVIEQTPAGTILNQYLEMHVYLASR